MLGASATVRQGERDPLPHYELATASSFSGPQDIEVVLDNVADEHVGDESLQGAGAA
jgi:hypothetical protein